MSTLPCNLLKAEHYQSSKPRISLFCLEKCKLAPAETCFPLAGSQRVKRGYWHHTMAVKIQSIPNKLHHSPAGLSSPLISLLFPPPLVSPPPPPLPLSPLSPFSLLFVSRQQGNGGLGRERERETDREIVSCSWNFGDSYARNAGACCEDNKVRRTSVGAQRGQAARRCEGTQPTFQLRSPASHAKQLFKVKFQRYVCRCVRLIETLRDSRPETPEDKSNVNWLSSWLSSFIKTHLKYLFTMQTHTVR